MVLGGGSHGIHNCCHCLSVPAVLKVSFTREGWCREKGKSTGVKWVNPAQALCMYHLGPEEGTKAHAIGAAVALGVGSVSPLRLLR